MTQESETVEPMMAAMQDRLAGAGFAYARA
jgi:hypothetical protein